MKYNVIRANPAGNITLFVTDPVPRELRSQVASDLMEIPNLDAEQVAFLCDPIMGGENRIEMMGGEFCGNAARAFGMLVAQEQGGRDRVKIEISGCDYPVSVDVDLEKGTARAAMPLPQRIWTGTVDGRCCILVHLGGIAHLIAENVAPSLEFFEKAEPLFREVPNLDAYGVMFLQTKESRLTPLVKVVDTDSLVWEGSCGSGSLATAMAQSLGQRERDGVFVREYVQPAGVVQATVELQDGQVTKAYIGGPVSIEPPVEIELY